MGIGLRGTRVTFALILVLSIITWRRWCSFSLFKYPRKIHVSRRTVIKTVVLWRRTSCEEGEDREIKGDGHDFLGCTRNHLHRLLRKRTNDNWRVLYVVITPVERRNQEKTSSFGKEKGPLPSRQCTGAHLCSFDGQNYGIKIQIITIFILFTGFGLKDCFLFLNSKKWLHGQRLTSNEVIAQTNAYFENLLKSIKIKIF